MSGSTAEPTSTGSMEAARWAAADALLRAQVAALSTKDRSAFAATLADPASTAGRAELAAFDVLTELPLSDVRVDPARAAPEVDAAQVAPGADAFVARATLHYRLAAFDPGPASVDRTVVVVDTPRGWRIAGSTPAVQPRAPWTLPGAVVRTSGPVLVIGNAPAPALAALADAGAAAIRAVEQTWRHPWNGHLVVVAPASVAQWQALLGTSAADPTQVAAVTDGALTAGLATADRIVVNPDAYAALSPVGRRVVIAHEAAHVAVRAAVDGRLPLWLTEGLAEVVGYSGSGLDAAQITVPLRERVRSGHVPTALPDDAAFDAAQGPIDVAYSEAWLAVDLLRERLGPQGVTDFVTVAGREGLDAAYRQVLGTTAVTFEKDWLARVVAVAR